MSKAETKANTGEPEKKHDLAATLKTWVSHVTGASSKEISQELRREVTSVARHLKALEKRQRASAERQDEALARLAEQGGVRNEEIVGIGQKIRQELAGELREIRIAVDRQRAINEETLGQLKETVAKEMSDLAAEIARLSGHIAKVRDLQNDALKRERVQDYKQMRKQVARVARQMEVLEEVPRHQMYAHLIRQHHVNTANPSLSEAVLELLDFAGVEHKTFVDIGCGRSGGNSHILASSFGWRGLMVDASEVSVERVTKAYQHNPGVSTECCFVTPENINELIARHGLNDLDFFSLDIDSYDYWVFKALEIRPRVISVEYNAYLGDEPVTVPLGSITEDAPQYYRGASLTAMDKLAKEKGYVLIGCDFLGVNAFWVRSDLCPDKEPLGPAEALRSQMSRLDTSAKEREVSTEIELEKTKKLGLELVEV